MTKSQSTPSIRIVDEGTKFRELLDFLPCDQLDNTDETVRAKTIGRFYKLACDDL